jgi:hypothetical protein
MSLSHHENNKVCNNLEGGRTNFLSQLFVPQKKKPFSVIAVD